MEFPDVVDASLDPQHCLYFLPLPQGQGSFRPILFKMIPETDK
jgi:hypothetical protein